MEARVLDWTLNATETPLLRILNGISSRLPLWTWKPDWRVRAREFLAKRLLHMDPISLRGHMPSGHFGTLMPQRMYFIESSSATLNEADFGRPTHLAPVDIGGIILPSRGILTVGQAAWEVLDPVEYRRTRAELEGS